MSPIMEKRLKGSGAKEGHMEHVLMMAFMGKGDWEYAEHDVRRADAQEAYKFLLDNDPYNLNFKYSLKHFLPDMRARRWIKEDCR